MIPSPLAAAVLASLSLSWLTLHGHAQSRLPDPHLSPQLTVPSVDQYVVVGDMLLLPEQLDQLNAAPVSRRQAFPYGYYIRLGTWDAGVIPYEFAPNFSAAERQRIVGAMELWSRVAPLVFVQRTTQSGFLGITRDEVTDSTTASPCFSAVGQVRRGAASRLNLGGTCSASSRVILHELAHAIGFLHEHQRTDRDDYIAIDLNNVTGNLRFAYNKLNFPLVGPYDFASITHYHPYSGALDVSRPVIIPHGQYQSAWAQMGLLPEPSATDHNVAALLYNSQHRETDIRLPLESVRTRFERGDMLLAMERLHAFYMSRLGLNRPQGLSIDGKPDFLGIAQWIFDVYLGARSGGFSSEGAFDIVIAAITRTDEWRQKNPGRTPLTPSGFRPVISFSRDEFLDVLTRLDRFYAAPEGLQRTNGLSIAGGPDFLGIAAWIFDIYLNERLNGTSPTAAWQLTENAIRATSEWRGKH